MKLLHLDSSIQGEASASRKVSAAVVERLADISGEIDIHYRDLAADPLPHISLPGFATEEAKAVLDEFLSADIVVIGAPMYNFGVSTQLKAWFDHIMVAGKTFRYSESGAEGLCNGKRVIVALSRGGIYSNGEAAKMEFVEPHLRVMLGLMGITEIEFIVVEGIAHGPEQRDVALIGALAEVGRIEPMVLAA